MSIMSYGNGTSSFSTTTSDTYSTFIDYVVASSSSFCYNTVKVWGREKGEGFR